MNPSDFPGVDLFEVKISLLLAKARLGDRQAMVELYENYASHFIRVVRHFLSDQVRRLVDSTDILQEVHLRIMAGHKVKEEVFGSAETFLAYFTALTANITKNKNRHYLQTRKRAIGRDLPASACRWLTRDDDPTADLHWRETAARVKEQMTWLDRLIFVMDQDGQGLRTIAANLGQSPLFVHQRLLAVQVLYLTELADAPGLASICS